MSNATCSVPGCERKYAAKGYCKLHWGRNRIHGDPLVTMKGKYHKVQSTPEGLRICKRCTVAKPATEFHRDGGSPDGLRAQCKPCRNGFMAEYYGANRDARVAYEQDRRTNRADHMRALDRARYERDKDKRVELATKHTHIRRARLSMAEADAAVTVKSLRKIHGDDCCYCGVTMDFKVRARSEGIAKNRASLEHILPLSRGGAHTFDNTALACHHCNVSKNRKTIDEWKAGGRIGRQETATVSADR